MILAKQRQERSKYLYAKNKVVLSITNLCYISYNYKLDGIFLMPNQCLPCLLCTCCILVLDKDR